VIALLLNTTSVSTSRFVKVVSVSSRSFRQKVFRQAQEQSGVAGDQRKSPCPMARPFAADTQHATNELHHYRMETRRSLLGALSSTPLARALSICGRARSICPHSED